MEKIKEFMVKGFKPFHVLGFVWVAWFLPVILTTLLFQSSWMGDLIRFVGSLIAVSVGIQIGRVAARKALVSPLDLLQFTELSIIEVGQTVKSIYYFLRQFRKIILFYFLLYMSEEGLAAWALEQWGGSLSVSSQESILGTLHVVYSAAISIVYPLGIAVILWAFLRIAIRNHFRNSDELMETILSGLEHEGIEVVYTHNSYGRCQQNVGHLLNSLANNSVQTTARKDLYWLIKNNAEALQRFEFFPHGKPKTLVQNLASYLQPSRTEQV